MVDPVGGSTPPIVQPQTQVGTETKVDGGVTTSAGVSNNPNLTVETSTDTPSNGNSMEQHEIQNPPDGSVDPSMKTPMQNMDDARWDETCDIFALIHKALRENAKATNEMEVEANAQSVEDLEDFMAAQDKLASDTTKLARNQGIAQTVGGAVSMGGGVAGGATAKSMGVSMSVNSAAGGGGGIATGIEGIVDASLQGDLKLEEKESTVAQAAQQKSAGLRDKHGQTFDKIMSAEESIRQQNASVVSSQQQAIRSGT